MISNSSPCQENMFVNGEFLLKKCKCGLINIENSDNALFYLHNTLVHLMTQRSHIRSIRLYIHTILKSSIRQVCFCCFVN